MCVYIYRLLSGRNMHSACTACLAGIHKPASFHTQIYQKYNGLGRIAGFLKGMYQKVTNE